MSLVPLDIYRIGNLICGEVSTVNDDNTDNCFAEPVSRYSVIEEDEVPRYKLCNENRDNS